MWPDLIGNSYFDEFKRAVTGGSYIANREQLMLMEYLEHTILSRDDMYFNQEMIEKYIRFSEKNFFPLAL